MLKLSVTEVIFLELKNSETKLNLMRAFAGESQARNRYNMASSAAKSEGWHFIGKVFDFTACQEQAHATVFYNFLKSENDTNFDFCASYPVNVYDSTQKLLEAAIHNEYEEYNDAYKAFAQTAKQEGFNEIANAFTMIGEIERIHAERFEQLSRMLEDGTITKGNESQIWVCTNCGHIHTGPSSPAMCPVCSHSQGYFVADSLKERTTILL